MSAALTIRPGEMRITDWRAIHGGADVAVDASSRAAVERAAATVADILTRDAAVYGINTGFGKLAQTRIRSEDLAALQRNLVLSHAAGVGPPLPPAVVRLVIALKIASLARGHSGVRWAVIEALAALLRHGIVPLLPAQGSVGASGDLAPLAHLSAVLIGEGEVLVDGRPAPARAALAAAGMAPLRLGPKEGLALLNGTQVSSALALAGLFAMERVFAGALVAGSMTLDALQGSDTPFDERIHAFRGHAGQSRVAAILRRLAAGSRIRASHLDCDKVQDPYSLRCQPQVMGAVLDLMQQAAGVLAIEANAVSDNPLVFADDGAVLSGGNFHAQPVAYAADQLALGMTGIGNIAERRIALLVDPAMSGLPAFLAASPGLDSGFMIAQVTAAALAAENKLLAHPASVDTIPTSANQEDHVSMATHGARRVAAMAENAAQIVAIEILAVAQGLAFARRRARLSSRPMPPCGSGCRGSGPIACSPQTSPPSPISCAPAPSRRAAASARCWTRPESGPASGLIQFESIGRRRRSHVPRNRDAFTVPRPAAQRRRQLCPGGHVAAEQTRGRQMQQRSTDLMSRPTSIAPIVFPFFAGRDARADGFTRRIAIDVDRVSILRRYMGIAMRVRVPVAAYRGVSLTEAATAPGRFDVNLVHADPDLTVTLCETANRGEAVAESRSWANLLTLPILGGEAAIEVAWSATPRSCNADATALRRPSAAARPKFLARRRVGTRERMCVVHRGEREMIAAD